MTENTEYFAMLARMVRAAGRRVADSDAEDLADLLQLRVELESAVAAGVAGLRDQGHSWQYIANPLGVSRQAVQQTYGGVK